MLRLARETRTLVPLPRQATGFYNGLLSPLIGYGIAGAVAFAGYDWAARQVKRWRTGSPDDAGAAAYKLTFGDALLAGMFAGVVNNVPRTVVDRLKTLAQAESISTPAALRRVLATQGPAGLLGGFSVTMAREVPQFSIYFATYGAMVNAIQPAGGGKAPGWQVACVGATAGVLQWLPPMYCIDVVKSRLQGSPPGTYRNMAHCAQVLYAEHGWRVFVRGLGPTIVRGIPLHATTFFVYETVMGVLSDGATH